MAYESATPSVAQGPHGLRVSSSHLQAFSAQIFIHSLSSLPAPVYAFLWTPWPQASVTLRDCEPATHKVADGKPLPGAGETPESQPTKTGPERATRSATEAGESAMPSR